MLMLPCFEGALKAWEDLCWVIAQTRHSSSRVYGDGNYELSGALENWHRFRQFLLACQKQRELLESQPVLEVVNDFLFPDDAQTSYFKLMLPATFTCWSLYRRVYSVSAEVVAQIECEDLGGLHWNDIRTPFPSFAIELEEGIPFPGSPIKTIVYSRFEAVEGGQVFIIQGFPEDCGHYHGVSQLHRGRIAAWNARGRHREILNAVPKIFDEICDKLYGPFILGDPSLEVLEKAETFSAKSEETTRLAQQAADRMSRIVSNFCRFLETNAQSGSHPSHWFGPVHPGRPDQKAIFRPEEAFLIKNRFPVVQLNAPPAGERIALNRDALRSLCWHYRKEHMRRPRGSSLDAPKSVLVKKAEIRKDRRPPDALPGGSEGKGG